MCPEDVIALARSLDLTDSMSTLRYTRMVAEHCAQVAEACRAGTSAAFAAVAIRNAFFVDEPSDVDSLPQLSNSAANDAIEFPTVSNANSDELGLTHSPVVLASLASMAALNAACNGIAAECQRAHTLVKRTKASRSHSA